MKPGKLIVEHDTHDDWDHMNEIVTRWINKLNPRGRWDVVVENFGSDKRSGYMPLIATTGTGLVAKVLPDAHCMYKVYRYGRHGLAINNAHHDSPTWDEWYYITPTEA